MKNITYSEEKIQKLISQNEQFKTQNIQLNEEKKELQNKNSKIENELIATYEKLGKLETLLKYHEEQQRLSNMRKYNSTSEKLNSNQLRFFDEVINEAEATTNKKAKELEFDEVPAHKRKKRRTKDEMYNDLDINETHHTIPKEEQICNLCNNDLHEIGTFKRDELVIIPAKVIVNRHIGHKYGCRECDNNGVESSIKQSKLPKPLFHKSAASPEAISEIIVAKYMNAVPLYRQEKYYEKLGVNISRQLMSNWIIKSSDYFEIIFDNMKSKLVSSDIINCDETPVQVIKEDNRKASQKSYIWVYKGNKYNNNIVLYEYTTTRTQENPKKFLRGYKGYIQSDGYAGYNKVKNVIQITCLAHIRRKFKDAYDLLPEKEAKDTLTYKGLEYCQKLYKIEAKIKELPPDEKYNRRLQESKPIIEEFEEWLKNQRMHSSNVNSFGKAIIYGDNQITKLKNYLLDGRLEIDNNTAERSIKPYVIGRKNWLFHNTPKGAKASTIIYSIVETAKESKLKVPAYLTYILTTLKEYDLSDLDEDIVESLMPWNPDVQLKFAIKTPSKK